MVVKGAGWVETVPNGSCGGLASDPTGVYTISGFTDSEDGSPTYLHYGSYFSGSGPQDQGYSEALQQLALLTGTTLAPLGSGPPPASSTDTPHLVIALAAALVATVLVATGAYRARVRS
jgi:hypothetical protein